MCISVSSTDLCLPTLYYDFQIFQKKFILSILYNNFLILISKKSFHLTVRTQEQTLKVKSRIASNERRKTEIFRSNYSYELN